MTQLTDAERYQVEQVKTRVSLVPTIEGYLGPGRRNGSYLEWLCPFHQEKTPSLKAQKDGDWFKCFGCGKHGDAIDFVRLMENLGFWATIDKLGGGYLLQVADPKKALEIQAEIKAENERKRAEQESERQKTALERLATMAGKVDWYHSQVGQALNYWHSQGLTDYTINLFKLGYAPECPTYRQSSSYVIPYFQQNQLISIRHRLANPNGCGKYRPEFRELPNQLFNLDCLTGDPFDGFSQLNNDEAVLVEGEVKALVLYQYQFRAVGIPGKSSWQTSWCQAFKGLKRVYIALDPDADDKAWQIGHELAKAGPEVKVVTLPSKPDDMFTLYGCTTKDFHKILGQGRIV